MPRPTRDMKKELWVEGNDDLHVVIHFLKQRGVDWPSKNRPVEVEDLKGITEKLDEIKAKIGTHAKSCDRFGIMLDADVDAGHRWSRLRQLIIEKVDGLSAEQVPEQLPSTGWVFEYMSDKWIGVWLMPDNREAGTLEDFLAKLIPGYPDNTLWQYACDCSKDALKNHEALFAEKDTKKASLRTFLAWQEQPGLPPGEALNRKIFHADKKIADAFFSWLNQLFAL